MTLITIREYIHNGQGFFPGESRFVCNVADAVASVSRPLAALREQQGARLAAVVPNGVDFARFYAANLLPQGTPTHPDLHG